MSLDTALERLTLALTTAERPDLASRVGAARVRAMRPATVICVVGEFKQGKSSLVNSLVGQDVCPVDDDIATAALTLVRHRETPGAVVRWVGDEDPTVEEISIDDVARFVTETADRPDDRRVERVDVFAPSPLLADGLVIVDTPGMGGLGAGHAAATLAFLPFADGLIFASDASTELTATELDFLRTAQQRCPNVMVAATKIDISPQWRRIAALNDVHLQNHDLADLPKVTISSVLRAAAFASRDRELNERSGFPELLRVLDRDVIQPAKNTAGQRACREAEAAANTATAMLRTERDALNDPEAAARLQRDATEATARLEALRAGSARWQTVLGDRITDLTSDVNHRLRGAIRATARSLEERIESVKTADDWDALARELQADVAEAVATAFTTVEMARLDIRAELAGLLAAEDVVSGVEEREVDLFDTSALWSAARIDEAESTAGSVMRGGLTSLRGAQGGVIMLGMGAQFLPQAAAVFIASNPVLLGAGALFGGVQLLEDRKRRLAARRQSARGQLRQFTDDVQFEVSNELTTFLRSVHRDLRDEFVTLISELQVSWTDAAAVAGKAAASGAEAMRQRADQVSRMVEEIDAARSAVMAEGETSQ